MAQKVTHQSMVHTCALRRSIDRQSMVKIQTTHYRAACTLQRSTVDGWTLKPLMIEQYSLFIRVRTPLNGEWFESPTIDVSIIYGPTINRRLSECACCLLVSGWLFECPTIDRRSSECTCCSLVSGWWFECPTIDR